MTPGEFLSDPVEIPYLLYLVVILLVMAGLGSLACGVEVFVDWVDRRRRTARHGRRLPR